MRKKKKPKNAQPSTASHNTSAPELIRAAIRTAGPPTPGEFAGTTGGTLALDLGARCGWAVADEEGQLAHYARIRLDKAATKKIKFSFFRESLEALIRMFGPAVIAYEKTIAMPGVRGNWRPLLYYEGILTEVAECHNIPLRDIYPPTLKKHATGNGRASKEDMVAAAKKRWNIGTYMTINDDIADALCILDWSLGVV